MRRRGRSGQTMVETTLILAAFMGLLLGMAAVGQMLFVRQALACRVQDAARWGALNDYDAEAIRNVVLYGAAKPADGTMAFAGLTRQEVVVANPGCPGTDCRVSVAVPGHAIQSTEPVQDF